MNFLGLAIRNKHLKYMKAVCFSIGVASCAVQIVVICDMGLGAFRSLINILNGARESFALVSDVSCTAVQQEFSCYFAQFHGTGCS